MILYCSGVMVGQSKGIHIIVPFLQIIALDFFFQTCEGRRFQGFWSESRLPLYKVGANRLDSTIRLPMMFGGRVKSLCTG